MSTSTLIYYCDSCSEENNLWSRYERRMWENDCMKNLIQYATPKLREYPFISKSHSNGKALLAISTNYVGCDLEKIERTWSLKQLEKRMKFFLSEEEVKQVLETKDPHRSAILAWTLKESYYKVQQHRKISDNISIVTEMDTLEGEKMKFDSKNIGQNMIVTCYHSSECSLEWHYFMLVDKELQPIFSN